MIVSVNYGCMLTTVEQSTIYVNNECLSVNIVFTVWNNQRQGNQQSITVNRTMNEMRFNSLQQIEMITKQQSSSELIGITVTSTIGSNCWSNGMKKIILNGLNRNREFDSSKWQWVTVSDSEWQWVTAVFNSVRRESFNSRTNWKLKVECFQPTPRNIFLQLETA